MSGVRNYSNPTHSRARRDETRLMIFVDSSVWIDYFNGNSSRETDYLDGLLGTEPVAIGDLVLTELLRGLKNDRDCLHRPRATVTVFR